MYALWQTDRQTDSQTDRVHVAGTTRAVWSVSRPCMCRHFTVLASGDYPTFHGTSAALSINHCHNPQLPQVSHLAYHRHCHISSNDTYAILMVKTYQYTTTKYKGNKSHDNHASSIPTLSFLQAGCPSCRPTNSVKALKGNKSLL